MHSVAQLSKKGRGHSHVSEGFAVCPDWANTGNNRDCTLQGAPLSNALCPTGTGKLKKKKKKSLEIVKKKKKLGEAWN